MDRELIVTKPMNGIGWCANNEEKIEVVHNIETTLVV